jgi:radical SAM superfamily enzyme YgiQ (UPF0313 family)
LSFVDDMRALASTRLSEELGTLRSEAHERVALLYPSPYATAMSSLGFQTIYREIHQSGRGADRAFLPEDVAAWRSSRAPLFTYEAERPVSDYAVVAISVAYELELAGLINALELAGIPPLAEERTNRHPFVLVGGPLTFSNPAPLAPFADAILMGEADETIHTALDVLFAGGADRGETLAALARELPSAFIPALHGEQLPPIAKCADARLPAYAQITTPNTELRDMFLVETSRGCSRGCRYCVMRRSTNGGMRIVPLETIVARIPKTAKRVGLVGAAVSDHPRIAELVEQLAAEGRGVGLSSLRPDRLDDRLVAALRKGGYRTLTTAGDGASERMRESIQRKTRERHLLRAAELAREHGMERMKLYMMCGLPGEEDEDLDELARFSTELSKIIPLALGIGPFVAKRNTPLDGQPFAGISVVEHRLERLRRGVRGRVDVRATSARWGWVEHVLAQGGAAEGRAVLEAVHAGGKFADWKRAFKALPTERPRRALTIVE